MTGQRARYQLYDKVFKEYVVQHCLSRKAFEDEYLVHNDLGKRFVLKVLYDVAFQTSDLETVMQLEAPRLVQILDYGDSEQGHGFVLVEYVRDTLERVMTDQGLHPKEARHYLTEILKGLKTLHENGIVHRNITPLNLFVQEDIVKIGGVESACCASGENESMRRAMGSLHYMAPERFTQNYSFGVDLWSAAVVFYRLLTGHHPFDGEDNSQIFGAIMQEEVNMEGVPKPYQVFFQRAFQKEPADRYQTPADMLASLEACIRSAGPARSELAPAQVVPIRLVARSGSGLGRVAPILSLSSGPKAGDRFTESHTGMVFMFVPEGSFDMGSPFRGGRSDEKPVHTVRLDSFWMGRYPVTVGQWRRFITDTGSFSRKYSSGWHCKGLALPEFKQTGDHPVVCVTWKEAEAFARWLSIKSGAQYRLPTEAEWEYAARGRNGNERYAGGNDLDALGWYDGNRDGGAQPAGRKAPNGLGLHDMSGNVWEWCGDWYDAQYYASSPEHNPLGPSSGSCRVLRGGSWCSPDKMCQIDFRNRNPPDYYYATVGFRLVRLPDQEGMFKVSGAPPAKKAAGDPHDTPSRLPHPAATRIPPFIQTFNVRGVPFRMVLIRAGEFFMGSPDDDPERGADETLHRVRLSRNYWLGETQVTQALWEALLDYEYNPSHFYGEDYPVENVSWYACQEFIRYLNQVISGGGFRLPTEAEWEYACRAGTTTPFYSGHCLGAYEANYDINHPLRGCLKGKARKQITRVASFAPNAWGLYDMHGNVREWCQDRYGDYPTGLVVDPQGLSSNVYGVLRGGSWYDSARDCRSARRFWSKPGGRNAYYGFRLVRYPGQW